MNTDYKNIGFKIKYLFINLKDKNGTIDNITESKFEVDIDIDEDDVVEKTSDFLKYKAEIFTYEHGQFAIQITDNNIQPKEMKFIKEGNYVSSLAKITDPNTNKDWWIESDRIKKYKDKFLYETLSRNHLEKLIIEFTSDKTTYQITLTIQDKALGEKGFKELKKAFIADLYKLILDKKESHVHTNHTKDSKVKEEIVLIDINKLKELLSYLEYIYKNPYQQLKHTIVQKNIRQVIPTTKTFIEYAQNPTRQQFSSRNHERTVNNPINGYLLYMIERLICILEKFTEYYIQSKKERFKKANESIESQNKLINQTDQVGIKFRKFTLTPKDIRQNLMKQINKNLEKLDNTEGNTNENPLKLETHREFRFKVTQKKEEYKYSMFICGNRRLLFTNIKLWNSLKNYHQYSFTNLTAEKNDRKNKNGGMYTELKIISFDKIRCSEIAVITNESYNNDSSIKKEKDSNEARKIFNNEVLNQLKNQEKEITTIILKLEYILKRFQKLNIQKTDIPPSSTVFYDNYHYAQSLKIYLGILQDIQVQYIERIESLEQSLTLYDLPKLYERWCLLKILEVLMVKLKFEPKDKNDWRIKLVDSIEHNKNSCFNITLISKETNINYKQHENLTEPKQVPVPPPQEIEFIYEGTLRNKKRPDYQLVYNNASENDNQQQYKLVMDAKYRSKAHKDLSELVKELVETKKYTETDTVTEDNANWVYVLAPTKVVDLEKEIERGTEVSYSIWAEEAYYGGHKQFEWGDKEPNLKYGGIMLSPKTEASIDNLQRLIAMFLQSKGFYNCIVCGGNNIERTEESTENGNKKYYINCLNKHCRHFYVQTHCYSCGTNPETKIFKHGAYWTYQSCKANSPNDIYNIACPKCGSFFIPNNSNERNVNTVNYSRHHPSDFGDILF